MTREEKQKAIDALKISTPVMAVTLEEFNNYIQTLNQVMDWLEQEPSGDAVSRDFQIGDEVRIIGSDPIYDDCDVGWVIRNASERVKTMYVMRNDGSADEENKAEWYKTGRHNAMLAEVIKQLPSVNPQGPTSEQVEESGQVESEDKE